MRSSNILKSPKTENNITEKINIFNKLRWTNLFGNKGILEGVKINTNALIKKENKKEIVSSKTNKSWWETKYENVQIRFWNKMLFRSLIFIGRGVSLIFPETAFIPKMIKAIEVAGPALTAVAAKILVCTGSRSLGWITGTIPWEKTPLLLENTKDIITPVIPAIIPVDAIETASFKTEITQIITDTFAPELSDNLEKKIDETATSLGVGGIMRGVSMGASLFVLLKGIYKIGQTDSLLGDVASLNSVETWVALSLLAGLGLSIYTIYKALTNWKTYKISSELEDEILSNMEEPKKDVVKKLINIVNSKK